MNNRYHRFPFPLAAAILLLGLSAPPYTPARVTWSWGAASQSSKALTSAGGFSVYQAPLNINGARADLSVFSFEQPCDILVKQLASLFSNASISYRRGTMAFFMLREKDIVIRLVIIQPTSESHALVMKIEQSTFDYESSIKPPERHLLPELPEFPSSSPAFYAANSDTDLQIAASVTSAGPAEVKAYYSQRLSAQGWFNPLNDAGSLLLFARGNAVCTVMTADSEQPGITKITLLHKKHGVK